MARPTRRRVTLQPFWPGGPPPTTASRLLSISNLAKAAADHQAKLDALGRAASEDERIRHSVQRDNHLHEIHCLAVELGLADLQPWRYGLRSVPIGQGRAMDQIWRTPTASDATARGK